MNKSIYKWAEKHNYIFRVKNNFIKNSNLFVFDYYTKCFNFDKKTKIHLWQLFDMGNNIECNNTFFRELSHLHNCDDFNVFKSEFLNQCNDVKNHLQSIDFDDYKTEFLYLTMNPIFKNKMGDCLMVFMIYNYNLYSEIIPIENKQMDNAILYCIDVDGELHQIFNINDLYNNDDTMLTGMLLYSIFFENGTILEL